jgi:eukaryotic-like serine/threonine-protein kinase
MSPEQARDSRATSIRSDIYSLGSTFYYLLTGSPPFPSGALADKLTRHCTQPPPDLRRLRPEVPGPLSQLIQRMMAKLAESRFNNYEELTAALDSFPTEPSSNGETPTPEPLYALVAEDDADSGDAIALELAEPEPTPSPPREKQRDLSASQPSFSIAELAALDADSAPQPAARRPPPSVSAHVPKARPGPDSLPGSPVTDALVEDEGESVEGKLVAPPPVSSSSGMDPATKKWIKKLVAAGVALVLLVIGIDQLVQSRKTSRTNPQVAEGNEEPSPVAPEILVAPVPPSRATNAANVASKSAPVALAATNAKEPSKSATETSPSGVESTDPEERNVPEPDYTAEVEDRFVTAWAKAAIPERLETNYLTGRRLVDPGNAMQRNSLRSAFEVSGGMIEVVDNGPFYEDDLRLRGDARLIRAAAGAETDHQD